MVDVVAVASCPSGIAHTYMTAAALAKAAETCGVSIKIETQGAFGTHNELGQAEIAEAKAVVIAADVVVDKSRFRNKPVLETSSRDAIVQGVATLRTALALAKDSKQGLKPLTPRERSPREVSTGKHSTALRHYVRPALLLTTAVAATGAAAWLITCWVGR